MGYIASSGRVCHCSTSASTSSVIVEIRSGQPSIHTVSIHARESREHSSRERTDGSPAHQNQASAAVIFRNTHRLKSGKPGAWNLQGHITRRREHRFGATAVAVMAHLSLRILLRRRPRGLLSTFDSILSAHLYFYIF